MSALPPKADMDWHSCDVRFVPKADIPTGLEIGEPAARERIMSWNRDSKSRTRCMDTIIEPREAQVVIPIRSMWNETKFRKAELGPRANRC
jgi:hypothetical protein